ncbi:hypothetical protein J2S78_000248 [Salibacterium salarium]|uniref:Uncharacterized protein n=1 Tax=Salibacterium salarium TaxID=284579 RepID=A0A428N071_9BACI|nr:hypothetical protein [Salibacterium salarium]MDQ0297840.1 hypothetical protein [Salibacterium salarium]RSL31821.1 hypothetical protein D7Z54_18660 [Salibacterium salarium]
MPILILFWALAIASIIGMIKWKKPLLLTVPFAAMGLYLLVQVIMVPLPFWETVQMIFGLR